MRTYAPFSCNPFRIRTYKKQRDGGRGLFWLRGSPLTICRSPQYSSSFFSHSCALFCAHQKLNPFLFKRFRTLCQKPPGGEACAGQACISLVFWDSAVKRGPIVSHLFRLFQLSTVDRRSRPCRDCQPLPEPPPLPPQTGVLEFQ